MELYTEVWEISQWKLRHNYARFVEEHIASSWGWLDITIDLVLAKALVDSAMTCCKLSDISVFVNSFYQNTHTAITYQHLFNSHKATIHK